MHLDESILISKYDSRSNSHRSPVTIAYLFPSPNSILPRQTSMERSISKDARANVDDPRDIRDCRIVNDCATRDFTRNT